MCFIPYSCLLNTITLPGVLLKTRQTAQHNNDMRQVHANITQCLHETGLIKINCY